MTDKEQKQLAADAEAAGLPLDQVEDVVFRRNATSPWVVQLRAQPGNPDRYAVLLPGSCERFQSLSEAMERIETGQQPEDRLYELVPILPDQEDPVVDALQRVLELFDYVNSSEDAWEVIEERRGVLEEARKVLAAHVLPAPPVEFPEPIRFVGMVDQQVVMTAPYKAMTSSADSVQLRAGIRAGLRLATQRGLVRGEVQTMLLPRGVRLFRLREVAE